MRVFKCLISTIFIVFIFLNVFSLETYVYSDNKIEVEVKGKVKNEKVYTLEKGSTFEDLMKLVDFEENADISNYSLQQPLYNKQVIVIGSNEIKKISINEASLEELCSLNGIGEKTALLIIDYRNKHNGFKYLEEIMKVKGIGEKKFEKFKDQISL